MTGKLKDYFPMIRTREELLAEIEKQPKLYKQFQSWNDEARKEFLDFCTGIKGVKMLYDSFFKEIMNPEYAPERLNELISLLLGENVKVLKVLPNDSTRIADETTLVIMDIVVELTDGSITNVEVQKIGYAFPGQRCACYSADLLLRQYKRVRDESRNGQFSFMNIKPVYTIVLFEKSRREFRQYPHTYIHRFRQESDQGIQLDLLQNYVFVALDIFRENMHNIDINNKLDAWLTFLCVDEPEWIIKVIEAHPQFKAMYGQIYDMCLNVERVMSMFSEELRELDRNTVQYMIDEMQDEIDRMGEEIKAKKELMNHLDEQLSQKDEQLSQKDEQLSQKDEQLSQQNEQIKALKKRISELEEK